MSKLNKILVHIKFILNNSIVISKVDVATNFAKLSIDNMGSVRTSLYLDNEYYLAVNHILDYDTFSKMLIFSKKDEN